MFFQKFFGTQEYHERAIQVCEVHVTVSASRAISLKNGHMLLKKVVVISSAVIYYYYYYYTIILITVIFISSQYNIVTMYE